MQNLKIVDHPLVQHKLTKMRKKDTPTNHFRQLLRETSLLLAYEITRNLDMTKVNIDTPIENFDAPSLDGKKLKSCMDDMSLISGQKPVMTKCKKSISTMSVVINSNFSVDNYRSLYRDIQPKKFIYLCKSC